MRIKINFKFFIKVDNNITLMKKCLVPEAMILEKSYFFYQQIIISVKLCNARHFNHFGCG